MGEKCITSLIVHSIYVLGFLTGCPIGFLANNCSISCRFPSYGLNCQKECNCTENICNFKDGCRQELTTYKIVANTIYTKNYTGNTSVHTWTNVKNIENPSREDIMTKSIDTNKRFSLHTVIVVLSIWAFILLCIYVSTFAMTPRAQGIRNNDVFEIHRNSEQV